MHKYQVVLCWSDEDEAYVVEASELPDCMVHGDTQQAALSNINDATSLWLDTAWEFRDPIPQPKAERLTRA